MTTPRGAIHRAATVVLASVGALALIATLMAVPAQAEERPTLRLGSTGDAVVVLEERLVELGYSLDGVDASFDADTRSAVLSLQAAAGIGRDGIVGPITWGAIDSGTRSPDPPPATEPPPATDPSPGSGRRPTLRLGSTGDAVVVLEERLVELGYSLDGVDASFDADTRSAVLSLQAAAGIGRDGIVGPVTWGAIDSGTRSPDPPPATEPPPATDPSPGSGRRPTLRLGSTGDAVVVLEERLVELGYSLDGVDASFDADTRSAVLSLQAAAGIGRDGIVGPVTWGAIDSGTRSPDPPPATDPPPAADPESLRRGSSGPAVLLLEQRLTDLGYWVANVDERFDTGTHHAVVALQKAAGLDRDGVVGPATRDAIDRGVRPSARTSDGHVIEVDLTRQLLLVVDDGTVSEIHDTSTGRSAGTTPVGTWTTTREIDGYRHAPLGTLYRPKYFYRGVAIHGYPSVPPSPASHGCVRVTYPAMDHLWETGAVPIGTTIEVYS